MAVLSFSLKALALWAIGAWPIMVATSVMLFPSNEAYDRKANLAFVTALLFYPLAIALLCYWVGLELWFFSPRGWLLCTFLAGVAGALWYRLPIHWLNMARGIRSAGYSKTARAVYYEAKRLPGADPASFVRLPEGAEYPSEYARDAFRVYYSGKLLEHADPATLQPLGDSTIYWKDAGRVYLSGEVLPDADPATFRRLDESSYALDAARVYFTGRPVAGADPKSFRALGGSIACDASAIYVEGAPCLPGADIATFSLIDTCYVRDAQRVYRLYGPSGACEIAGADPATFENVDYIYARDRSRVYIATSEVTQAVAGADPATFVVLDYGYAKDASHVYYDVEQHEVRVLPDADPASFEPLGWRYARDTRHVYFRDRDHPRVIDGADRASFEVEPEGYNPKTGGDARDGAFVYLRGQALRAREAS